MTFSPRNLPFLVLLIRALHSRSRNNVPVSHQDQELMYTPYCWEPWRLGRVGTQQASYLQSAHKAQTWIHPRSVELCTELVSDFIAKSLTLSTVYLSNCLSMTIVFLMMGLEAQALYFASSLGFIALGLLIRHKFLMALVIVSLFFTMLITKSDFFPFLRFVFEFMMLISAMLHVYIKAYIFAAI